MNLEEAELRLRNAEEELARVREHARNWKRLARRLRGSTVEDHLVEIELRTKRIYELFGYREEWHIYPIDAMLSSYWLFDEQFGKVHFSPEPFTVEDIEECRIEDRHYEAHVLSRGDGDSGVWRSGDYAMFRVDTQTDGNMFLSIFDASKEIKVAPEEPKSKIAYTVGDIEGYDRSLRTAPEVRKVGRSAGYEGGWVWKTAEEARAFLTSYQFRQMSPSAIAEGYGVYSMELPNGLDVDTISGADGLRYLLRDARIIAKVTFPS